jgi:hypothetical protein
VSRLAGFEVFYFSRGEYVSSMHRVKAKGESSILNKIFNIDCRSSLKCVSCYGENVPSFVFKKVDSFTIYYNTVLFRLFGLRINL